MSDQPPARMDGYLVAAGKYHDIDHARLEVLKLAAEHDHVRITVADSFEDHEAIAACSFLISYTCDVRPSETAQAGIRAWVEGGGRWLALHGTNAALDLPRPNGVESPRCFPTWASTIGSQFVAHPPIMAFEVSVTTPDHWLVEGIEPFETDDELYVCEYHEREKFTELLHTSWNGEAAGFEESDWTTDDPVRLVQYLRPLGAGGVLYNTLGHCRGHWDMAPMADYYPKIERGSWNSPQYYELLRRALRWTMGEGDTT